MKLLEYHFDTAFDAPDGIKKLRELILTLAMKGKLVPQDPNDHPASELLKELESEKRRLVKQGKIKEFFPILPLRSEDAPYSLPNGWEWVKLGLIALIERGGSPRPINAFLTNAKDGLNWIKIGDTQKGGKFITATSEKIRPEGLSKTRKVYPGDFLLTNSMSFGRPYIAQIEGCIHDGWLRISPPELVNKDYLYHLLSSSFVRTLFETAAAGAVVQNLNADKVRELPIPLPPLNEQSRIVAKIDELMARCDALEKLRAERDSKRLSVHTTAVRQLLNVADTDSHTQAREFIGQHFSELYTVKENVTELRKAILQLAVMGKLIHQDPSDPPASELLMQIEVEKKRLVKAGKIRAAKPLAPIDLDESPFVLPNGWNWAHISDLAESIDYGTSQKTCDDPSLVPVYRMGNIVNGKLVDEGFKYIRPEIDELPHLFLRSGDILFNRTNSFELVGKSAHYLGPDNHSTFASYLIRIRLVSKHVNPMYVSLAMDAPYFRETQIVPEIVQQCGQANFNGTKLSMCAIPLPPLPEQSRIVSRIDQLMSMCDALEQQIGTARESQSALLNAMMAQYGGQRCA